MASSTRRPGRGPAPPEDLGVRTRSQGSAPERALGSGRADRGRREAREGGVEHGVQALPESEGPPSPAGDAVPVLRVRGHGAGSEGEGKDHTRLTGEGRIGDESVAARELREMGSLAIARHLMVLLAKGRGVRRRADTLARVGELVIALETPSVVRRVLLEMADAGRIVDIYPLEVLAYVLERRMDLLDGFLFERFVLNREELEAEVHAVNHPIVIKIPLSLKMRAFALDGGGSPGYCFQPGAPGQYGIELGEAGTWPVLLRGELRGRSLLDRVVLRTEEPPERDGEW